MFSTVRQGLEAFRIAMKNVGEQESYYLRWDPKSYEPGDSLPPSRRWEDGVPTDETLPGTSALNPRYRGFSRLDLETYYRGYLYLVTGEVVGGGEDPGEVIIRDARVVQRLDVEPRA